MARVSTAAHGHLLELCSTVLPLEIITLMVATQSHCPVLRELPLGQLENKQHVEEEHFSKGKLLV